MSEAVTMIYALAGRSPHGERGLKLSKSAILSHFFGRSPHGERGLKYCRIKQINCFAKSLSSRRAWIEILPAHQAGKEGDCRSPHGERGLK